MITKKSAPKTTLSGRDRFAWRRVFMFLAVNGSTLTSSPSKHNILTKLRRAIVFSLTVASIASMTSAQAPYAFKKDPGNNQQIEYTSDIFSFSWSPVPGGLTTNVAPAAVTFNRSIFLFAVKDKSIWLNTLAACGGWSGWVPLPPGGDTDVAVAPVLFGNSLIVIRKGVVDKQLYFTSSLDGVNWSSWRSMDPAHQIPNGGATSAPTAIAMTNSNFSFPLLFVSVRDGSGKIQIEHLKFLEWSGWVSLGFTDFAPSLTKFASFTPLPPPTNCYPGDLCLGGDNEADTLYLTRSFGLTVKGQTNSLENWISVSKTTDGNTWSPWFPVKPSDTEAFPTTPAAPASYGYPSASGGSGLLVFVNAYGSFEGFKKSSDPSLGSWGPWKLMAGAPSDAALAITGAPIPCLK